MMIVFVTISTFIFLIAGINWRNHNLVDTVIKAFLIIMAVIGLGLIGSNTDMFLVSG